MTRESDMKEAAEAAAGESSSAMEKLQNLLLTHGYNGIMRFGRMFRIADDDGSRTLNQEELGEAIHNFGLHLDDEEVGEIFSTMDEDGTGTINYEEFLDKLRPEMTEERKAVVAEAYSVLDESGDGVVTLEDLKDKYDASGHPSVLAGEATEDDILLKFLGRFEGNTKEDGKLTKEEFMDYYSGISKSIDDDDYFVEVVKKAWKL
ncbi:crustacean calcium-binding protein 23 [Cherax quadricarinatus]